MRPRFVDPRPAGRSPSGFTLVEVLVAIVLIEIGLLALTAASGIVIRELTVARARLGALEIARNRVETLIATPCAASSGSAVSSRAYREDWSSSLVPRATRDVRDSVTFSVQGVARAVVFHTRSLCTP